MTPEDEYLDCGFVSVLIFRYVNLRGDYLAKWADVENTSVILLGVLDLYEGRNIESADTKCHGRNQGLDEINQIPLKINLSPEQRRRQCRR